MIPVEVRVGDGPIVLAQPHSGIFLPAEVHERLNDLGREIIDTDWHIPRLYEGLVPGATTVTALFNRYVIDANRDPNGGSLYPGQNTTGLVPLTTFDGDPIWQDAPTALEVETYLHAYHEAYHTAVREALRRAKAAHGIALLFDCHSIRSVIPYLFEGVLPALNIGTFEGRACDPRLTRSMTDICARQADYSFVVDGRFKGGWTTRHYGDPENGVHAIQMELSQTNYLTVEEQPFAYDEAKAHRLRALLSDLFAGLQDQLQTMT